tara:strand:- start:119 stop:319 length:201 start_codon:yes stop_codon:yes gene_type:complete
MLAEWNGVKPTFLCEHETARRAYLVKYTIGGMLHWLCDKCYREKIYVALRVDLIRVQKTGKILESF